MINSLVLGTFVNDLVSDDCLAEFDFIMMVEESMGLLLRAAAR